MKQLELGCLLTLSLVVAGISGCGAGGGLPDDVKTGTVTGTVSSSIAPLPEGCVISFYPEGGLGLPAGGSVAADGTFKLRLKGSFELPTGIYKIVVLPPPMPEMSDEEAMEASVAGSLPTNDAKGIPTKYRSAETTTEVIEVKEGANEMLIELKE